MDAKEFLRIAKKLIRYNSEANWRTSIGRSYYAVFNYLKEECSLLNITISSTGEGHGELAENFNNSGIAEGVIIGSKLNDLRSQRNIADYELKQVMSQATAKLMYEKALEVTNSFPSIDKTAFQTAVFQFRGKTTTP